MKLTKKTLTKLVKEVITETDGFPKLLKKNKEVAHNWATHMEWKSSTYKKMYGDVIGEVKHHTLLEDGSTPTYDVQLHQSYHHTFLYQWKTSTPYESLSYELLLCFSLWFEDEHQFQQLLLLQVSSIDF